MRQASPSPARHRTAALCAFLLLVVALILPVRAAAQERSVDSHLLAQQASRVASASVPLSKMTALERHLSALEKKVTIEVENATLEEALLEVVGKAGLTLSYDRTLLPAHERITLRREDVTVTQLLWELLADEGLWTKMSVSGHLILTPVATPSVASPPEAPAVGTIAGRVVDEASEPIPGANVVIAGTTQGASTDMDGYYRILDVAPGTYDLQATFVGYRPHLVEGVVVQDDEITVVDFQLEPQVIEGDEVVVVGYGTMRKRDLTGSVGSVNVAEAMKAPVTRMDQAIQGRVPGVFVTSINGRPGAGTTIRVRGANSINAGNEPLYVIDGFVGGSIASLNPNDIESIEVLKDASAVSIYGARGSNGVVLVTTKSGQEGTREVQFNAEYGSQMQARRIDLMNAQEYMRLVNQGERYLGNEPAFSEEDMARIGVGTDWQDVLIRSAPMYNAQLSFRGGAGNTRYYISGSHLDQEGLLIGNSYSRSQLRVNLDHQALDVLSVGTSLNFSRIYEIPEAFWLPQLINLQPTVPVRLEDGSYSRFADVNDLPFNNPVAEDEFTDRENRLNHLLANSYVELTPLSTLKIRSTLGVTVRDARNNRFVSSQLPFRIERGESGSGSVFTSDRTNLLTENTATYTPRLGRGHRLNLLAGFTYQRQQTEVASSISDAVLSDLLSYYGLGLSSPEDTRVETGYDAWRLSSLIGRANYVLSNKYLLTVTARRDGSSKFGPNNRYAFFPSVAVGWSLSEEPFIRRLNLFDHLKLRMSYGESGNSNGIGSFARFQSMNSVFTSLGRGSREVGVINQRLSNPDLRWETTNQVDLGLEFGFLDGRLNFEFDVYRKKTRDLLFTREVPRQTGFTSRLENIGSVKNTGGELLVDARLIDRPNVGWDASFNISAYRNEITDLGSENHIVTRTFGVNIAGPSGMLIVGEPLGVFTGFKTNGIYKTEEEIEADGRTGRVNVGEFRFVDISGDGAIDQADITVIGDPNPDFFGGFQNTLRYGSFELSTFFQFVYGADVYNIPKVRITRVTDRNAYRSFNDAWSEENPNGDLPRAQAQNAQSSNSFNVEDGSFLRLKTLQLGYRVPAGRLEAWGARSLRLYVSAHNLFHLVSSEYSNFDPETNAEGQNDRLRGYDNITYPLARTLSFGVSLGL